MAEENIIAINDNKERETIDKDKLIDNNENKPEFYISKSIEDKLITDINDNPPKIKKR